MTRTGFTAHGMDFRILPHEGGALASCYWERIDADGNAAESSTGIWGGWPWGTFSDEASARYSAEVWARSIRRQENPHYGLPVREMTEDEAMDTALLLLDIIDRQTMGGRGMSADPPESYELPEPESPVDDGEEGEAGMIDEIED